MSKLINEDWEHASRAADEGFHTLHQQYIMEAEYQQWEHEQAKKKKPTIIKVIKPKRDEATHNASKIRRAHQEKL
tara:strand:- start:354 stop:578 length:225 start_codon:yes stop_codon:yes gene_type:complete